MSLISSEGAAVKVVSLRRNRCPDPSPRRRPCGSPRVRAGGRRTALLILAVQREGSRRLAARLRDAGLTPAQAESSTCCATARRSRSPNSAACWSARPAAQRLVDALVQRGLVARTPARRTAGSFPRPHEAAASQAASAGRRRARRHQQPPHRPEIASYPGLLRKLIEDTPEALPSTPASPPKAAEAAREVSPTLPRFRQGS